jgi:hypothetical protein
MPNSRQICDRRQELELVVEYKRKETRMRIYQLYHHAICTAYLS